MNFTSRKRQELQDQIFKCQMQPPNIIDSISLSETGVRFGCKDAFPPSAVFFGAAGTSELAVTFFSPPATDPDLGPVPEEIAEDEEEECLLGNFRRF